MEMVIISVSVFFVALIFSMFGMGGGLLYTPLFLFFIGDQLLASQLSFSCICVTAISAMRVYYHKKLIDWRLVGFLGFPLISMIFISGFLVRLTTQPSFKIILGITLILAGTSMMSLINYQLISKKMRKHRSYDKANRLNLLFLSPVTAMIGFLCGISGISGGVFEIPIMINILEIPSHMAVATSSAIVFLASLFGILGRILFTAKWMDSNINFLSVFGFLCCAFLGACIGPRISINIKKEIFKKICGIFVLLTGIYYMVQGIR